jgi:hypothetical protein
MSTLDRNLTIVAGIALTASFTALAIAISRPAPEVIYQTEVRERLITQDVITTLDIEQLKDQINELDQAMYDECVAIIVHRTGDPQAGVIHRIERHYNGDACQAADEALRGEW